MPKGCCLLGDVAQPGVADCLVNVWHGFLKSALKLEKRSGLW